MIRITQNICHISYVKDKRIIALYIIIFHTIYQDESCVILYAILPIWKGARLP